jgi:hypothetical protein
MYGLGSTGLAGKKCVVMVETTGHYAVDRAITLRNSARQGNSLQSAERHQMGLPKFTNEQIATVFEALRTQRPDILARFEEHERRDEGISDIGDEIEAVIRPFKFITTMTEMATMMRELRVVVRRRHSLPI